MVQLAESPEHQNLNKASLQFFFVSNLCANDDGKQSKFPFITNMEKFLPLTV